MDVKSLGYRTDLIFPHFDGEIIDRGDYLVVLTPANPDFYWGNFLLFADPPGPNDLENWTAIFAREIGWRRGIKHRAFGWDSPAGDWGQIEPFREAGFYPFRDVVMTAAEVIRPARYNIEIVVKTLLSDGEWDQALQAQLICHWPGDDSDHAGFPAFMAREMERYRVMTQAGLGHWFGAFLGEQFTATLGLFVDGQVGRFQQVATLPDFRRRGICSSLVYQAAGYAFERMGVETLVMVADDGSDAARLYERLGFKPAERQVGVHDWWK